MRKASLALLFSVATLAGPSSSRAAETAPTIEYPAASDFLVLEVRLAIPLTPDSREGPAVRVYGDGRVVQHRPSYMKRGGNYQAWLSHAELDQLLQFVAAQGLMEFDPTKVEIEQRAAEGQRLAETGSQPLVADAPTTILSINLDRFAPAGVEEVTPDFSKAIVWYALDSVTAWYPEVEALQRLKEVASVLWTLGERTEAAAGTDETLISLPDLPGRA